MLPTRGGTAPYRARQPPSRRGVFLFLGASLVCTWLALEISMARGVPDVERGEMGEEGDAYTREDAGNAVAPIDKRSLEGARGVERSRRVATAVQGETGPLPDRWSNLTHLIMVAGHTIYMGDDFSHAGSRPQEWYLADYQRAQLGAFKEHIRTGVRMTRDDPSSLLLFSGSATRPLAGPRSEGASYWLYAEANRWFREGPVAVAGSEEEEAQEAARVDVAERSQTEEFAHDSFENLLFSVCRFRQLAGRYPESISVVSLPFKERRFRDEHRKAMRFPEEHFHFIGVGDTTPETLQGESKHALEPYRKDPYGCNGTLAAKKRRRNPYKTATPYPQGCEEIAVLFSTCGPRTFAGPLPWDPVPSNNGVLNE